MGFLAPSWLKRALAIVGAVLVGALTFWRLGKRDARKDAEVKSLKDYKAAMERVQDADLSNGNSDDDRDWLSKRGQQ